MFKVTVGLVMASAAGVYGLSHGTPEQCCTALMDISSLEGKVYQPGAQAYQDRLDSYWSKSAALEPWCMFQPHTAEDVSAFIKVIVSVNCPFGIRGGGHGAHPLSNSVQDGVTIDFGKMDGTEWHPDTRLASIQPGGHWQTVYDKLAPNGVIVTGARAGTVGTGGFIGGGGNSFHSASHGMACDTVANFQVVLADGSIVDANATSNPDLWKALKGGSGNFGLVTRFDMYTIDFPDPANPVVWGGNLFIGPEHGDEVIDALVDFTDNVYKDENSSSIVFWAYEPQAAGGTLINAALENTVGEVRPSAFDGYFSIDGIYGDTTKVDTMTAVVEELGAVSIGGYRNIWYTASFKNDPRPMRYAVEKFNKLNEALELIVPSKGTDLKTLCMFQPISKSIVDKGVERGGNSMGLEKYVRDGNGIMFLVTLAVNGEENEAKAAPLLAAYIEDVDVYTESLGLKWDWKYGNYAHSSQDVYRSYGDEVVERLQAVSSKYDPNGVFQRLRGSGFKLPPQSPIPVHREL